MKLGNKLKLLAMVCGADVILLGGLFWTVLGNRPVHAAAGNGTWVQEGGETLDRAKGLEGKCVALTFDDGPHEECTAQLLDGLKERGVRVTFFLMGQNIEGNEELVKRMHDEGHLIGNHSHTHVQLTAEDTQKACEEIDMTNRKIFEITGEYPTYIRPPYGSWSEELECMVPMTVVLWDIDPLDWKYQSSKRVTKHILKYVEDNSIILLHDVYGSSVDAALEVIDTLTAQGYTFVTVDELLID